MRVAAVLMLAVVTALAACSRRPPEPPPRPAAGLSVAERVRVLNGDVLVVDGRHIRLADAVAPQPVPDARCWAEALAAKQTTAILRELVRSAQDIKVQPTGARDEYNREIAHVVLDHQDLGRTLHDMGLIAEAQPGRFSWCNPISAGGEGAPDVRTLMDFGGG
jgi:hypothetical protein